MASNASVPSRGLAPKPPDKGSFLLDHFRECTPIKENYLRCIKGEGSNATAEACRTLSADYLKCRMDRELMLKEDLTRLGYHDAASSGSGNDNGGSGGGRPQDNMGSLQSQARKEKQKGYLAGVPDSTDNTAR